jgi:hypothetical protein
LPTPPVKAQITLHLQIQIQKIFHLAIFSVVTISKMPQLNAQLLARVTQMINVLETRSVFRKLAAVIEPASSVVQHG